MHLIILSFISIAFSTQDQLKPTLGQPIILNVPAYAEAAFAPHKGNLYTSNNSTAMYIDTQSGPDRILNYPTCTQ